MLYEALRLLLERVHPNLYPSWAGEYEPYTSGKLHLVRKVIYSREDFTNYSKIFGIYHDVRAVAASLTRMGWLSSMNVEEVLHWCETYTSTQAWLKRTADCVLKYEDFLESPSKCMLEIAEVLGMAFCVDQGLIEQLHRRHDYFKVRAVEILSSKIYDAIQTRFSVWLEENGYQLDIIR